MTVVSTDPDRLDDGSTEEVNALTMEPRGSRWRRVSHRVRRQEEHT